MALKHKKIRKVYKLMLFPMILQNIVNINNNLYK